MGKKANKIQKSRFIDGKYYPFVSVCTPTFNRRPFIPMMFECFKNQTYPKSCIEWIIVDDGTDKIRDLVEASGISQIRYFELEKKMPLGEKRNYMHKHVKGSIVVYMDDDDYYPPERISHCVEKLNENKSILVAGASEIYVYFKHIQKMVQCGPYGAYHATAGTFAFRSEFLQQTKYDDAAALAEEKVFLKNYTVPMVQLDPVKTILVFSHNHNTFDKRKMLENMHPDYCKFSPKTVDDFITNTYEAPIKKFFMNDIDDLLEKYKPGDPIMKPDVLENMKKIHEEREKMMAANGGGGPAKIMLSKPGETPVELTHDQVINIIQQQQMQMQNMSKIMDEQRDIILKLQRQLATAGSASSSVSNVAKEKNEQRSKSEPVMVFDVAD